MAIDCCGAHRAPAVALFRTLGNAARLAIVSRLAEGEARVVDLTRLLGLAQSTVSGYLACLRDCRHVDFRTEGRQSFYSLRGRQSFSSLTRSELMDVLRSAERLLAETGNAVAAVALCRVYGESAAARAEAS